MKAIDELKKHDRWFRQHARCHPEHVMFSGEKLGEGLYNLCNQTMWPEISGRRVWEVSPTYWTG